VTKFIANVKIISAMKIDQMFDSSEMGIAPTGNPRSWAAVYAARVPPHS